MFGTIPARCRSAEHCPFGNGDVAKKLPFAYPADYIAEGMDQTRGWFYTLLAISTRSG